MTAFFALLFLGVFAALLLTWAICDYGVDLVVGWWNRRHRAVIVDLDERRKLRAIMAIREGQ